MKRRVVRRELDNLVLIHAQYDTAHDWSSGIVEMDDCFLGASERLERAANQRLPGLCKHLDGDIVRDQLVVDQVAKKVEFNLRG